MCNLRKTWQSEKKNIDNIDNRYVKRREHGKRNTYSITEQCIGKSRLRQCIIDAEGGDEDE